MTRKKDLTAFKDAKAALASVRQIYDSNVARLRSQVSDYLSDGKLPNGPKPSYPYVQVSAGPDEIQTDARLSFGNLPAAGTFGTTLTRPDLFARYYLKQIELLLENHGLPLLVGESDCAIPLPFVAEPASLGLDPERAQALQRLFAMPDISEIDDTIANGTQNSPSGEAKPLALFTAERVDYSLVRLKHYTATSPEHFQRFVLFTNYQRYVDEFIAFGQDQVLNGGNYRSFVEPGDRITTKENKGPASAPANDGPAPRPQMPAYHLTREGNEGITLVNIGIGPSNAKTITDHIAVLRPHCWLMVGHCGGLRKSQLLGDYVLAHAYVRADHVLDDDLPTWVPVPPIAEVQVALSAAVAQVTGLQGIEMKTRLRTGTVFTTDDRDWELRHADLALRINQSRAIAVDMESGTIAANGYRFRVPYGTLLCVSDKPLHGEIKLPGMANAFYDDRISQHLKIGITTLEMLRDGGVEVLHSRKLRSFDEPAFR